MSKARELVQPGPEEITLSSGVTVRVSPFPAGLWEAMKAKTFEDYPDPVPPKKKVKVVDGTEEVDDLQDEKHLSDLKEAERQRNNILGEAVIDLCVQVDLTDWEHVIQRMSRYVGDYPEDPDDRRIKFLTDYALRTKGDYEAVMISATTQMMVSDPEVRERLKFFRREMEGAATGDTDAPGADEGQRVDVHAEAA